MTCRTLRAWARHAGLAALCWLALASSARAAFGAHYEGHSRDGHGHRLYLDGGAYLGNRAGLQAIRITVQRERRGVWTPVAAACTYLWRGDDHLKSRIECAASPRGPLAGAVYARDGRDAPASAGGEEALVCVRACGAHVPARLLLQDADEDNH